MRTTLPDIFAAGDCVETWHRLLERNTYLPLGQKINYMTMVDVVVRKRLSAGFTYGQSAGEYVFHALPLDGEQRSLQQSFV